MNFVFSLIKFLTQENTGVFLLETLKGGIEFPLK